jgi:RNA polymerase sigma-70 factor (ECF subfamily)
VSEFLAATGGGEVTAELRSTLADVRGRAHKAWPDVTVDDLRFARELARRIPNGSAPVPALQALPVEDCYLAVACTFGDRAALAHFEREHLARVRPALGRLGLTASEQDETLQALREELLVTRGGELPRIHGYLGRGNLRGWVRAVAVRMGMRLARRTVGEVELHESAVVERRDPELEHLKRAYRGVFQEALTAALAEMSTEDRLLLKRRFGHGLSCDELGALYGMHKSTAARKVTELRGRLLDATRLAVATQLNLGRAEFSTLLRLVRSELHLALSSVVVPEEPPRAGGV